MKLQFFAEESNSALDQLDELLDGANQEGSGEAEDTGEETPPDEVEETPPAEQNPPANNKANTAFAQMRVQNTTYKNLLSKIAQATGIEFTNEEDLISKLNDDAIDKLAKLQNVSPELLRRMEMLEQNSAAYEQEKLQSAALIGFQKLKDTYKLSDEELQSFAVELDQAGKNPFEKAFDIEAEYKLLHFNDITQRMVDEAVKKALATSGVADNHSTTPNSSKGKGESGGEKITTLQGLNNFLDSASK